MSRIQEGVAMSHELLAPAERMVATVCGQAWVTVLCHVIGEVSAAPGGDP
jgi:hypothetical protein